MEKHRCNICYRSFSNGRALGGHMRSHVMESQPGPVSSSSPQLSSLSLGFEPEEGEIVSVNDRESETDSYKTVTRRRSKRSRKPSSSLVQFHVQQHYKLMCDDFNGYCNSYDDVDQQLGSSVSDVTSEEDVAFCLMMLSRDKWSGHVDQIECNNVDLSCNNSCDDKNTLVKSQRKKYKCDTCNKVFRSYQALGGHRASHKKTRVSIIENLKEHDHDVVVGVVKEEEKKIHECPICFRVFASGQALGGHKRSHVIKSDSVVENSVKSREIVKKFKKEKIVVENLIDLNLPATIDDVDVDVEEGKIVTQIATSTVF
ncbi:hypothetical protein RND81_03G196800 [Saponaria officinalis]|uniref:C2H2-type domain-containing protein n=1 Tax=Saponaria officinalis TaxID=3572 RepID=A0AAW1M8I2_SAPOF